MRDDGRLRTVLAKLIAACLASLGSLGCANYPVRLLVEHETVDVLARNRFEEDLDPDALERAIRERLGPFEAPPADRSPYFWRVDLAPDERGPFQVCELSDTGLHTTGIRSGDLILAKNAKAQSLGTALSLADFVYYDHAGLLELEDGHAWVYECWPRIHLFRFAPDFASRFAGKAERIPLAEFAERYETLEFIRLPNPPRAATVLEGARESLGEGIRFDPHHDPDDPSLSCCEYLLYLFEDKAGARLRLQSTPVSENASALRLSESLGFHTTGYIVPDAFAAIPRTRSIAILSRHDSAPEVRAAYFAYELLHARFGPDSEIGSFLAFDGWRLVRYRRNVAAFLDWSVAYAASLPDLDTPESRSALRADLGTILPLFFQRGE